MNVQPTATDLVTIKVASFDAFREEASELLKEHWRELATYQDIPLEIDESQYRFLEQQGHLMIVTMRVADRLCGYAVFIIAPNPHYAGSLQAKEDIVYIAPAVRRLGLGRNLIRESEVLLRAAGVQVVHHAVKLTHPALGKLLVEEGYQAIEILHCKRLDGHGDR